MRRFLIILLMFAGCASDLNELKIVDSPSPLISVQVKEDYDLIKSVYRVFSDEKLSKVVLTFKPGVGSYVERKNNGYYITSDISRGVWVHELMHYFAYHVSREIVRPDVIDTNREEFLIEVAENLVNGISGRTFKREFVKNKP